MSLVSRHSGGLQIPFGLLLCNGQLNGDPKTRPPETLKCSKCGDQVSWNFTNLFIWSGWWTFNFKAINVLDLQYFKVAGGLVFLVSLCKSLCPFFFYKKISKFFKFSILTLTSNHFGISSKLSQRGIFHTFDVNLVLNYG